MFHAVDEEFQKIRTPFGFSIEEEPMLQELDELTKEEKELQGMGFVRRQICRALGVC